MQTQVDNLLQKRMDRKDFLKHVGIGVALITGVAGVLKLLGKQEQSSTQNAANGAYGAATYGGSRARA